EVVKLTVRAGENVSETGVVLDPLEANEGTFEHERRYDVDLLPVDLDIVHPAAGELDEGKEDVDDGGYVSVQRLEDPAIPTSDVTPKTKLLIHSVMPDAPADWKVRLKFDAGGRYKIYKDEARTQEVTSESTEFAANADTTLWFHGLKKSDARGGESITMQIKAGGNWVDGDSVKCTIVQSEFLFQVKAFIPYAWTEAEEEIPGPNALNPMNGKVAKGDLHPGYGSRPASPGFLNAYSTDRDGASDPAYLRFQNAPFRVCQTVIVTPYEELHATPDIQGKRKLYTAPLSEHFEKATSVNAAEMSLKMGFMSLSGAASSSGKPPANTPSYEHIARSGRVSEITIDGGGKDGAMPWGTTWATADIHWRLYLKVWCDTDPLKPKVEFGGKHDSYPAYEIIVIQSDGSYKDIHRVSPAAGAMPGPHSLDPDQAINVGRTDTITK
ncbi:hypothetical protein HNR46_003397, partial [Haloferula luteola]